MVKLECSSVDMDPKDSSGGFPEKVHTFIGLFIGELLVFFSVLYHTIGEISGKVKNMVKLECSSVDMDPLEGFPEKNPFEIRIGNIFRNFKTKKF
jgi:hypothetical protein